MFIGRREYLEDLESLWRKRTSSIVVCRGRRRIGKSTLIREFARRSADVFYEFEGLPPHDRGVTSTQEQLSHFAAMLARQANTPMHSFENWYDAFFWLDHVIEEERKTVVLLDEISWMGAGDANFPGILRTAWETFFHRHEKLIIVLCGSVSAWIQENILDNTGFTGRFSRSYLLPELSLEESAQFFGAAASRLSSREILDVLSVTGGIPRYLEEVDAALTSSENIRRMCFDMGGQLFQDFDAIFNPLFGSEAVVKRKILSLLCDGPLSGSELSAKFKVGCASSMSRHLRELQEGGFISDDTGINPVSGKEGRVSKYRLRDNYTRFYLKYVEPRKNEIIRGAYRFISLETLPEWNAVMGLQFENLIVNNARAIFPFLGLENVLVESAAPYRNVRSLRNGSARGCQIDLLIQTPRSVYVVEVKRMARIDESIIGEVEKKISCLPVRSNVSIRPVLVFDGELSPAIEASGYFSTVLPARKLLGV